MEKQTDKPTVNRKVKDSLFRLLFSDKTRALSLYNAVNDTDYTDETKLEFKTLEDAIYLSYKNDNSFILNGDLSLYEHQSSFNPNMPLRGLIYFSKMYEGLIVDNKAVYSGRLVKIPTPKYIVFYNGRESGHQEDIVKLKLSDAYINPDVSGEFEWTATLININAGHNSELLEKCNSLKEYVTFIEKMRMYISQGYERSVSVRKTIDDCISENVLKDFLSRVKSEVSDMFLTEFDEEGFKEMLREEGRLKVLIQMVDEGLITKVIAADKMNVTEEQFDELRKEYNI